MKRVTKQNIDDFLNQKSFAFIGVSRKEKHFPNVLYKELKKKEFDLFPINPNMEEFNGEKCYPDINSLSKPVDAAILTTPKSETNKVLQEVYEKGIKHIWIQQGAHTKETAEFANDKDINLIANKCLFMFANPTGIHKFHRTINSLLGILLK